MNNEAIDIKPQRRGGRPKKSVGELRSQTIGVRVSELEYESLRGIAQKMGMTPAQWLRDAALSRQLPKPPVAAINREVYAELARLAANINQLTRSANEGRVVMLREQIFEDTLAELNKLRLLLLGVKHDR